MKLHRILIPLVTIGTASAGSVVTNRGMQWYQTIHLPSWTPPGAVIGAVWTVIFILATLSACFMWDARLGRSSHDRRLLWIVALFFVNAELNMLWSEIFFGFHRLDIAVIDAALIALTVYLLIPLLWHRSRVASLLLIPYAAWTTFATYLAYAVWMLNV